MEVSIFTDGSSLGNPGPGGFCALIKMRAHGASEAELIKKGSKSFIVKGGEPHTTNNRMEMSAIIAGLYWLHKKIPKVKICKIFSDSNLIISTINHGWKRKKNKDLWEKLDHLIAKFEHIEWHWIRGHAGHPENTKADRIAVREAKRRQK